MICVLFETDNHSLLALFCANSQFSGVISGHPSVHDHDTALDSGSLFVLVQRSMFSFCFFFPLLCSFFTVICVLLIGHLCLFYLFFVFISNSFGLCSQIFLFSPHLTCSHFSWQLWHHPLDHNGISFVIDLLIVCWIEDHCVQNQIITCLQFWIYFYFSI